MLTLTPLIAGEPSIADVLEKTTPKYSAVLTDDNGNALPAASLATLTLTLYAILIDGSTQYINSRHDQNVLNTNNVTVDTLGNIVWAIQTADLTIIENVPVERHIALFTWTWSAGQKTGRHELHLMVKNLAEVS